MNYTYVLYLDVLLALLAANFLFDYLLLWATGEVTGHSSTAGRISLGALMGAAYFFLVYFARLGIIPGYGYLRFPGIVLGVGGLMIWFTFQPRLWRRFASLVGSFVGIGLIAGGAGLAAAYITGDGSSPNPLWGTIMALASILLVAELGWGVVHRRVWQHIYYVPIEVGLGGKASRIDALVDTGNRLQDPLTGRPVIVVELEQLLNVLPPKVVEALKHFADGFGSIDTLVDELGWGARFCLVPFSSLGAANGLMPGFRPDYVKVTAGGNQITLHRVIIGVCQEPLDKSGAYHALVPPDVLGTISRQAPAESTMPKRGESLNA